MAPMQADTAPITLRDYLAPVLKRKWLVVFLVVVVTAGVYFLEARRTPTYSASTKDYVAQQGDPALGLSATTATPQEVADQATLLTSTGVAAQVARQIGFKGSPQALAGQVSAAASSTTDFITITAEATTPTQAARIANAFAQEFIARNTGQQQTANSRALAALESQLRQLPKIAANGTQRNTILSEIQQLQLSESSGLANVQQIDPAEPPGAPNGRPTWEYAALAAIAALIGSVLLAYLLHRLDPRLRNVEKAADIYGRPVLATVTHDPTIGHFVDEKPALSPRSRESFRELCVNLDLTAPSGPSATVLVTSAIPGEGKSTVARNLALALSEAGRNVALLDADLRRPSLAHSLGVKPEVGLTDVVSGEAKLQQATVSVAAVNAPVPGLERTSERLETSANGSAPESNVYFIAAGALPANPPAVTGSDAFRAVLAEMSSIYEIVVIDSTPLTAVSDAMPLLGPVDAILLVARSGMTDQRSARHAAELIARVHDANVIGVVVNDVPLVEASAYGVGYGYGYGSYKYRSSNGSKRRKAVRGEPTEREPEPAPSDGAAAESAPECEADPAEAAPAETNRVEG